MVKYEMWKLKYKNPKPNEPATKYSGHGYVTVERPVHRLVLLIPVEERNYQRRTLFHENKKTQSSELSCCLLINIKAGDCFVVHEND